jgi:hypothetical protein
LKSARPRSAAAGVHDEQCAGACVGAAHLLLNKILILLYI